MSDWYFSDTSYSAIMKRKGWMLISARCCNTSPLNINRALKELRARYLWRGWSLPSRRSQYKPCLSPVTWHVTSSPPFLKFLKLVSIWGLFFFLFHYLRYVFFPVSIPYYLHYYNFIISLYILKWNYSFFVSFWNVLAILGSILFYINFKITLLSSTTHVWGFYRQVNVSG